MVSDNIIKRCQVWQYLDLVTVFSIKYNKSKVAPFRKEVSKNVR